METMKTKIAGLMFGLTVVCGSAVAQIPVSNFVEQNAERAKSAEDQQYSAAEQAMNDGNYAQAAKLFGALASAKGRRADAALYWKAYAQNKQGLRNDALTSIAELRRTYSQSRWLNDASALEVEIQGQQGRLPNPDNQSDEEIKLLAINALMQSDEERAIPMLEKILSGNSWPKLKERSLFVLSQSGSSKAKEVWGQIARGQQHPELQRKARHYLGTHGSSASRQL